MDPEEIKTLIKDAKEKHNIKIEDTEEIRSLIRLVAHRMYSQAYKDIKEGF